MAFITVFFYFFFFLLAGVQQVCGLMNWPFGDFGDLAIAGCPTRRQTYPIAV